MKHPIFHAPSLETMNGLLPAFEFTALVASNDLNAVYLAKQRSLERDVAVKLLAPHVSESPEFRGFFETTARTMARLNHPNLIGVFDSGYVDGMLYYIMEYVSGRPLENSMRGQQVEFTLAVTLVEGISDGLAHAHAHGIVHGDLRPSHILLNPKAEPKISSFGFTHPSDDADDEPAEASPYTAPEITARHAVADARSDIYSLGAILYELITGRPHSPQALPPAALSSANPEINNIWRKATNPDPALRFPDMRSFREALTALIRVQQAPVAGPPITHRLGRPPDTQRLGARKPPPAAVKPARIRTPRKHSPNHSGVALNLLLLVVLMIAVYFVWQKIQRKKQAENPQPVVDTALIHEREEAEARLREVEQKRRNSRETSDESTGSAWRNQTVDKP